MARSTCVYVVMGSDGNPIAGFTVKHELVTWLGRRQDEEFLVTSGLVWRCGDGLSQKEPRPMTVAELVK